MNLVKALLARLHSIFRPPPPPPLPPPKSISRTGDEEMWQAYGHVECTRKESVSVPKVECTPQSGWPSVLAKPGWLPPHVRIFERRRRKHDKFVIPNGPAVVPHVRPKTEEIKPKPVPKPVVEVPTTTDLYIVDKHHEDTEKVLYTGREHCGEFTFRDTILQQLDRYFFYLRHMKKSDHEAYALYRQVGAQILPYITTGSWNRARRNEPGPIELTPLPEWFNASRPAFGCIVYGADPETEKFERESIDAKKKLTMWVPKFIYYTKFTKAPPELQRMKGGGDIYVLTVWWDTPVDPRSKNKYGVRQDIGFHISKDGRQITALRMIDTELVPVRSKLKHETFHVPKREWHMARDYERWAKAEGQDTQLFLADLFVGSIQKQQGAQQSLVRVTVEKDRMRAVFSVNHERLSYFFQDRDIELTESGRRKPIFHVVRAHTRADGTDVPIRFRGERRFTWAGYDVLITVPGRDHLDINQFTIGAMDEYWTDHPEQMMEHKELGSIFAADVAPSEALAKLRRRTVR